MQYAFGGKEVTLPNKRNVFIDGHKMVCMDPPLMPVRDACTVLSFGIGRDWSFDDYMDAYGCQVIQQRIYLPQNI